MDERPRRIVRGPVFYPAEPVTVGSQLRIDRGGEFYQLHTLVGVEEGYVAKSGKVSTLLKWETYCTECGGEIAYTVRNKTKDLQRRCKPCADETPYDPRGWSQRPRNQYIRIDPLPIEDDIDPASLF